MDNVVLIDYTDFANFPDDFLEISNDFSKKVYYEIFKKYTRIIHSRGGEKIENKSRYVVITVGIKDGVKKVLRKNKNLVKLVHRIKTRESQ